MKLYVCRILSVVLAAGALQYSGWAADGQQTLQDLSKTFAKIAQETGQTVVAIETEKSGEDRAHPSRGENNFSDDFFFPNPGREGRRGWRRGLPERALPLHSPSHTSFGSGILLDEQGHIATVSELVKDSKAIAVTLQNGTRSEAEVVGSDKATGIAVIKIEADALPTTKLGDSDQIAIGELMVAVGHTAHQELTVSFGMISGVGRNPRVVSYGNWIEIDANLRSGSGGGAVVNTSGKIIGMSIANSPDGAFAIPINTVRHIATELIEQGKVVRGWLGVWIEGVDSGVAEKLELDGPTGALIKRVGDDTPAERAGLQEGDVIIAIAGKTITGVSHLRHVIAMYKPDTTISITVARDGETLEFSAALDEYSEGTRRASQRKSDWRGMNLQNLTADLAEEFEGYAPEEGVLIVRVEPGSPAAEAGEPDQKLRQGDLILEVEHQPVHSVGEFKSIAKKVEGKTLLHVKRGNQVWFVVVK